MNEAPIIGIAYNHKIHAEGCTIPPYVQLTIDLLDLQIREINRQIWELDAQGYPLAPNHPLQVERSELIQVTRAVLFRSCTCGGV